MRTGDALGVWPIDSGQLGVDDEDRTRSFSAAEAVERVLDAVERSHVRDAV